MENYRQLLEQREAQELEASGGVSTPQVYTHLLSLYLVDNDVTNAGFLLERIPPAMKSSNPELQALSVVVQRMNERDFPAVYAAIAAFQWSENIKPAMEALRENTRNRAYALVAKAYTSIAPQDLAALVGHSAEEAVRGALSRNWKEDPKSKMVIPEKPTPPPVAMVLNEEQLTRLTDYVAFLEN